MSCLSAVAAAGSREEIFLVSSGGYYSTDTATGNSQTQIPFPSGIKAGDTLFVWTMGFGPASSPVEIANWDVQGAEGVYSKLYMREATADANDAYSVIANAGDTDTMMFVMRASNTLELAVIGDDLIETNTKWRSLAIVAGADNDTMLILHAARNTPNNPVGTPVTPLGDLIPFNLISDRTGLNSDNPPFRNRYGRVEFVFQSSPSAIAPSEFGLTSENNSDNRTAILRYRIKP